MTSLTCYLVRGHTHTHTHTHTQLLTSLRVLLTLPPPTTSTHSQDLHKQTANGISELVQSRAAMITSQSDWLVLFAILEYVGLGISREQPQVAMETAVETKLGVSGTEEDAPVGLATNEGTESCDGELQSDSSVPNPDIQLGWVVIPERDLWNEINSFDLFSEQALPVHEPQVGYYSYLFTIHPIICL